MNDIFRIQDYSRRLKPDLQFQNEKKFKDFSEFWNQHEGKQSSVSSSQVKLSKDIQTDIAKDPYRKKLFDASVEMESMFVKMMLKEMKSTLGKEKLIDGGQAEEIFTDFLYDEYAKDISANSKLGLAEQIYSSLEANVPKVDTKQ